MGTSSRAPAELSREELEDEVSRLRELEEQIAGLEALVGTFNDVPPEDAFLRDVSLAGAPAGILIDNNRKQHKEIQSAIQADDESVQLGGDRDQMLPIHRMWADLKDFIVELAKYADT